MLWDLYGENAKKFYRTWNTCVKLSWELPRATHTYFVDNLLAATFRSFATSIKSKYVKFFQNLLTSKIQEVRLSSELVGRDASSTTGKNLIMLEQETGVSPWSSSPKEVSDILSAIVTPVPQQDHWRLPYLQKLLTERYKLKAEAQDTQDISFIIDNLCVN